MRQSNKSAILDAAVAVIEAEGITAVTFDSVAAAANLTRGGIIYHFRSRDDLLRGVHEHLARQWEGRLVTACGKPAAEATPQERLIAYVRVAADSATRADLQMLIDSRHTPYQEPWTQVLARWTPTYPEHGSPADDAAWMAMLAADGLWLSDVISQQTLTAGQRARLVEQIVERLRADDDR